MTRSNKRRPGLGLMSITLGALAFAAITALAFIGAHFFGQKQNEPFNFFDYFRALVGMPSFFLFGGAIISQLTAAFICMIINAILGATVSFILASTANLLWLRIKKMAARQQTTPDGTTERRR